MTPRSSTPASGRPPPAGWPVFRDPEENGIGEITDVKLGFVTHDDLDHLGGFASFPTRASGSGRCTTRVRRSNAAAPRGTTSIWPSWATDENPGSIALRVMLGAVELYTAGDQTSDDWKPKPDAVIAVVRSGVLGTDSDVDVVKANHQARTPATAMSSSGR